MERFAHVTRVIDALRNNESTLAPERRQAIFDRARDVRRGEAKPLDEVEAISDYVDCVARTSFKVTDAHFDAMREAGVTDDEIYDVTLGAAIGASAATWEAGLSAIDRARERAC